MKSCYNPINEAGGAVVMSQLPTDPIIAKQIAETLVDEDVLPILTCEEVQRRLQEDSFTTDEVLEHLERL